MNIGDVYFGKREIYFDVHVKPTFVLASTVKINIVDFWGILYKYVGRNMGYFTHSKCKVAGLLRFAHFGMGICGSAQLSTFFPI